MVNTVCMDEALYTLIYKERQNEDLVENLQEAGFLLPNFCELRPGDLLHKGICPAFGIYIQSSDHGTVTATLSLTAKLPRIGAFHTVSLTLNRYIMDLLITMR